MKKQAMKYHNTYNVQVQFMSGEFRSVRLVAKNKPKAKRLAEQFDVFVIKIEEVF